MPMSVRLVFLLGMISVGCAPAPERAEPSPAVARPAEAAAPARLALSPEGMGALRIGMTPVEAEAALGAPLVLDMRDGAGPGPESCTYGTSTALPGVAVMVEEGRVSRIDLAGGSAVKTDRGFGLNDTADKILAAYGAAMTRTPHKYEDPPAAYLEGWNADRSRGVRYETDGQGVVTNVYAGGEAVGYVEGCA